MENETAAKNTLLEFWDYIDHGLVLTDASLNIIAANKFASKLSKKSKLSNKETLVSLFPSIKECVKPEMFNKDFITGDLVLADPSRSLEIRWVSLGENKLFIIKETHEKNSLPAKNLSEPNSSKITLDSRPGEGMDALISTDTKGVIKKWDAKAESIFGYTSSEMIGQTIGVIFDDPKEGKEIYRMVNAYGHPDKRIVRMKNKKNQKLDTVCSLKISEEDGKKNIILNVKDLAEILRQFDEIMLLGSYLETLIEEAPVGIMIVDNNEQIIRFNKKQEKNSQIKREDVLGHSLSSVFAKTFADEKTRSVYETLKNSKTKQASLLLDHYTPQYYDEEMAFRIQACNLGEGMGYAIFCEIEGELYNAKRSAEETGKELRLSQKYLSALLDASPNIVISVDNKHRILSFNKTAEMLLGIPGEDIYGIEVDRFFPDDEQDKLKHAISSPSLWYDTVSMLRADSSNFLTELYSTKITDDESGKEMATLLIGKDMEETNQLRQSLIQSQKMSFLGEIIGGIAHQINNPLVGVINIADILLQKTDKESELYNYVRMIWDAGNDCKDIVSRMLRFSRKSDKINYVYVNMIDVLNASLAIVARQSLFRDIKIKKEFGSVPLIHGDLILLQQAMINVLWNAAQASSDNGEIEIGCSSADRSSREVMVTIKDHGKGIPEKDLPKIFEPFFTTKKTGKGTGLGLSLSYWIIKDHRGRIEVESTEGKGSTFKILLPTVK
jgi:PAS domain S-box-containing protein